MNSFDGRHKNEEMAFYEEMAFTLTVF